MGFMRCLREREEYTHLAPYSLFPKVRLNVLSTKFFDMFAINNQNAKDCARMMASMGLKVSYDMCKRVYA